jgi:predicted nucleic acid-binding protein
MPVVSNTSPLLSLAIIGRLSLLRDQFTEVLIPPNVLEELRVEEALPGSEALREAMHIGWLRVKQVDDRPFVQLLQRDLDQGEAEAIALAKQLSAEWILLDEREARRIAKSLELRVTGVLGVLLTGHREGKLPSLLRAMQELQEQVGFHISAELFAEVLKESGGSND